MTDPELIVSLKAERNRLRQLNERLWITRSALVIVIVLLGITWFLCVVLP